MKILFVSFFNGIVNALASVLTVLFWFSGGYLFSNIPIASGTQVITNLVGGILLIFFGIAVLKLRLLLIIGGKNENTH